MAAGDNWGQASVNNTNGFGKGAENNSIGWGGVHGISYGHPRTNLTGGGGFTGLLDDYPGAAAAYSLRLLRSDYSGGLVRVMAWNGLASQGEADIMPYKVGDDYVVDLNSTLENLDAIAIVRGLTTSDTLADLVLTGTSNYDGLVPAWYDQSINGNNATQVSAANQPKIVSAGSLILENGKPAVDFNGSNFFNFSGITLTTYTSFAVYKKDNSNSFPIFSIASLAGQGLGMWNDGNIYENAGSSFVLVPYTNDTNQNLIVISKKGASRSDFEANQNSIDLGAFSGTVFGSIEYAGIGRRTGIVINGKLQELGAYSVDNSSNVPGIETNINNFYSIYP